MGNRLRETGNGDGRELEFRPSKWKGLGLVLLGVMFVAGGVILAMQGEWVGSIGVAFFGPGTLVLAVQLIPGSTALRISEDGLTMVRLFRAKTVPWSAFDRFFVVSMPQGLATHKMVAFNFAPSFDRSTLPQRTSALMWLNTIIADCEGALPDTYGKRAEELADILNRCLNEFRNDEASSTA